MFVERCQWAWILDEVVPERLAELLACGGEHQCFDAAVDRIRAPSERLVDTSMESPAPQDRREGADR